MHLFILAVLVPVGISVWLARITGALEARMYSSEGCTSFQVGGQPVEVSQASLEEVLTEVVGRSISG